MGPAWEKDSEDVLIVPESGHVDMADQNLGFPWCRSSARQHSDQLSCQQAVQHQRKLVAKLPPPYRDVRLIVQRVAATRGMESISGMAPMRA